jgi:uncharacterized SAM-binding protein YcdF (DUF218 family)
MSISRRVLSLAQLLWDYHHMNHEPEQSDCILVLGSHDLRVADRGAELFLQGYAPLLVFSGGLGNFTKETWTSSEAELFAEIAIRKGVPEDSILIENKSTNTGENILFTQQLLRQSNVHPESFLLVQKPYMERRSYATFKKNWPDKKLLVTSPQYNLTDYPTDEIPMEKVLNIMVGDLERIRKYPAKGFQIYQEIPDDVWAACEELISLGYDKHLMKD